jgi:hypothetical protein
MNEITLGQLTSKHLQDWQAVDAIDDTGVRQLVWDSDRMVPFSSADTPAKVTQFGVIKVKAMEANLEAVYAKLAAIDPFGDRRLVR